MLCHHLQDKSRYLFCKYLINTPNSAIRADSKKFNSKRITDAKDENEIWNIVNDITNPRKETNWKLNENDGPIDNEQEIAKIFNNYFVEKIENYNHVFVTICVELVKKAHM